MKKLLKTFSISVILMICLALHGQTAMAYVESDYNPYHTEICDDYNELSPLYLRLRIKPK
jgi:hypothetical protein